MAERAVYVYCIVDAPKRPAMGRVPRGLPGASAPATESLGGTLWLIAATVPLDTYGSGPLEASLRDLDWVGRVAVAHEAVVEHFTKLKDATVVPAKLFTMFSTMARAVADTRSRRREIASVIRRIAGCEEWGVRVIRSAPAARTKARTAAATTGAGFLAAKRQARDEALTSARVAAVAALDAFDTLTAAARESRKRDDVPENAPAPPLLDAAFLVPATARARFRASARRAAEQCAKGGAELTLSGPWPAYNFIQPEKRS